MTSRELVRTAIVVGGIYLIVSSFSSTAGLLGEFAQNASHSESPFSDFFALYLPSAFGGIVVGCLPGAYAIWSSYAWADRLVPADESRSTLEPSLALSVGAMILGLSFGVSGAISLATSGVILVFQIVGGSIGTFIGPALVRSAIYGAFSLVAGILLFRWGSSGVIRAA